MYQGRKHVRRWRYMFYGIPPARYHRGYVVVFPEQIQRPNEYLQRTKNTPDQQVWYGCPYEGDSLHLLNV